MNYSDKPSNIRSVNSLDTDSHTTYTDIINEHTCYDEWDINTSAEITVTSWQHTFQILCIRPKTCRHTSENLNLSNTAVRTSNLTFIYFLISRSPQVQTLTCRRTELFKVKKWSSYYKMLGNTGLSSGWATEETCFGSPYRKRLLSISCRLMLTPNPQKECIPTVISLLVKRQTHHWLISGADIKNAWNFG